MEVIGIRTDVILPGDSLVQKITESIERQGLEILEGDILAIASKAVATSQNRIVKLDSVIPSEKAKRLAKRCSLEPGFVEVVLQEADKVIGGVPKALLTLKDHILTANAGVDRKNSPHGCVTLWPKNPFRTAKKIKEQSSKATGKRLGVLIVDSRVSPLRMGTTGLALGVAGFQPVVDHRGRKDLYGSSILITRHAVADDLAGASHLIMGESGECIPAVLIRGASVIRSELVKRSSVGISADECLFTRYILKSASKEFP